MRSAIRFITTHAKAIWGDFNVALTQSLEGASTPTQRPSPAELTEEERGCLDRLLDFNTQPQRLSETNRLLLAAKEMLRPLAAQQDAPCTAALLTLLVQNTRLDELRVVSACEFGFAAIAQLHGLIERVIHDVGARRDSDV